MSIQQRAWGRLLILLLSTPIFALIGISLLEAAHPFAIVDTMRPNSIILQLLPRWVVALLVPLTAWQYARYLLAPLGAFLLVFLASALYVQDIYALETFSSALRYVFSSMFGLFYPKLTVDGGKKVIPPGEINTLDEIGGPGYVSIRPGNAVIFHDLVSPPSVRWFGSGFAGRHFMSPFERIVAIVDLDEQEGYRDEVWTVSLDGIQLHIRDIRFGYRHLRADPKSPKNNYPVSISTIEDSVSNLSAGDPWQTAVGRIVVGEITGFISEKEIDYLTAPRKVGWEPREELRKHLFAPGVQGRLRKIGAELVWVDVGHFDIIELSEDRQENVDWVRLDYWASRWMGEIKKIQAIAEAKRMAYQERGRVEAQAAFLQSITDALRGFELAKDPAEKLRRLLLVRTAQILENMGDKKSKKEGRQ